ncbi:MAG: sigma 54-interacting transcriptional regulator [Gemmatimonadota bacterium]
MSDTALHAADPILGSSRAAGSIRAFARLAAGVDAPVLITGETGTGKGALAAAVHRQSRRAAAQLVAVNCAGVPESLFESEFFGHARGAFTGAHAARRGLFEQAHAGSLFLDEIGELSLGLQAKLLTAIEAGEVRRLGSEGIRRVDARIIAATAVDIEAAAMDGTFRIDLYHRLLVLAFHMPPLRERGGDSLLLARHFVSTYAARHGRRVGDLHPDTIRIIHEHPWPGNIRQLAHAMEAAVLMADGPSLTPRNLPARLLGRIAPGTDPASGRYSFYGSRGDERAVILAALRAHHGNMTRTARALRMSRNTLRRRILQLDIDPPHTGIGR